MHRTCTRGSLHGALSTSCSQLAAWPLQALMAASQSLLKAACHMSSSSRRRASQTTTPAVTAPHACRPFRYSLYIHWQDRLLIPALRWLQDINQHRDVLCAAQIAASLCIRMSRGGSVSAARVLLIGWYTSTEGLRIMEKHVSFLSKSCFSDIRGTDSVVAFAEAHYWSGWAHAAQGGLPEAG